MESPRGAGEVKGRGREGKKGGVGVVNFDWATEKLGGAGRGGAWREVRRGGGRKETDLGGGRGLTLR